MRKFLAATAAIAMAASMAHAQPGGGGDRGGGNGKAEQMKGGGNGKADRGPPKMAERGPPDRVERGPQRAERGNPDRGGPPRADRGRPDRAPAQANRTEQAERNVERRAERRFEREVRDARRDERGSTERAVDRRGERVRRIGADDFRDVRGLIAGCPPGLAKKNNGCMPPGLTRQRSDDVRYRNAFYQSDWWGYRGIGDRVFYDDGYLYRVGSNNSVLGYIPLLGGALSVGNPWPSFYEPVAVPNYYVDYYDLGPQDSYRYADNVLYRINPENAAITSIAALLTGDDFAVGQPMPAGYDVYNVPHAYRDRYYDQPDASYRYSDGYVYQVDPKTRLIAAAIELLI